MARSDRIFGLVVTLVALAYIASATQIRLGVMSDPLGPRAFPILVGAVAVICGAVLMLRPDPEPDWPGLRTLASLGFSVLVMVGYAHALEPMGFLLPTAATAAILSYQIHPRAGPAVLVGLGLSAGLFLLFKHLLGLGLVAFPTAVSG